MDKVKKFWDICKHTNAVGGWLSLLATIFLFIGAALCPPMFVIDPSILAAGGILFAFGTLWKLPEIIASIEEGKSIRLSSHGVDLTVSAENEK